MIAKNKQLLSSTIVDFNMEDINVKEKLPSFSVREPGSAITHLIGMIFSILGAFPLMAKAGLTTSVLDNVAMLIFISSMILLYGASTTFHTFNINKQINTILKKMDHMMISVLIAGSYTPICLLVLGGKEGLSLLALVWGIAFLEILIKAFFVFCPKWFSSVLYIGMGWLCLLKIGTIHTNLGSAGFAWLFAGGVIYTIGGVIYALKLPIFNGKHKNFGSHEIFHLFVMGGSLCHFIVMYSYVLA